MELSSRYVGNNNQYKIFKFYINNGSGRCVQVIAWNDEIDNIEPLIKTNFVSGFYYLQKYYLLASLKRIKIYYIMLISKI